MKKKVELVLCIILICILIFVIYLKFFIKVKNIEILGYSFFIVKTGSMEPIINSGELIIVKKQKNYKEDEIITYKENDVYITHRIKEIDGEKYITKGDANNENDLEIERNDILGKVIFHSEILGKIITDYLYWIIFIYIGINIILFCYSPNKDNIFKEKIDENRKL